MLISAIFGSSVVVPKLSSWSSPITGGCDVRRANPMSEKVGLIMIECSSRPQKKGTKHHMKTRPRKSQPWDIKRRPTVYPPFPPLPPDWTLVAAADETNSLSSSTELAINKD